MSRRTDDCDRAAGVAQHCPGDRAADHPPQLAPARRSDDQEGRTGRRRDQRVNGVGAEDARAVRVLHTSNVIKRWR
jgi:hypothetical protein